MFLICGEALFDLFPRPGGDAEGDLTLKAVAGGSPFNVALGLARLGRVAGLCSELSEDGLGRRLRVALKHSGVNLDLALPTTGPTPLALVESGSNGSPTYVFHGLRQARFHPDPAAFASAPINGLHLGSVGLVSPVSGAALLTLARGVGGSALVSLDPNVRLAVEPDARRWRDAIEAFAAQAHLIKVSVEDIAAIHGEDAEPEAICRQWLTDRCGLVALTRGSAGATLWSRAGRVDTPAADCSVVDTVGAGDTYQAAMLCWLDEAGLATPAGVGGLTLDQLAAMGRFCARAAALTCARRGPDLPWRGEL